MDEQAKAQRNLIHSADRLLFDQWDAMSLKDRDKARRMVYNCPCDFNCRNVWKAKCVMEKFYEAS